MGAFSGGTSIGRRICAALCLVPPRDWPEARRLVLRWVLILEAGLLSYLLPMIGLRLLWTGSGSLLLLACSPIVPLLLAACAHAWQPRLVQPTLEPRWTRAAVVLAIGLLFIAIEIACFSHDYEAAQATQSHSSKP
jgi:hypothetical protein